LTTYILKLIGSNTVTDRQITGSQNKSSIFHWLLSY